MGQAAVVAERKRLAEGGHSQEHAPRDLVERDLIGIVSSGQSGPWRVV